MNDYTGWIVEKRYYKVYGEASDWEQAKRVLLEACIDHSSPNHVDWDIYDIRMGGKNA